MFEIYKFVEKPWGWEQVIAKNDIYCLKRIMINAGHKTSLQYHEKKRETNFILKGEAIVTIGENKYTLGPGSVINLEPGVIHRIEAITDVVLVEASSPEIDDVVRIEDSYGRKGTSEA